MGANQPAGPGKFLLTVFFGGVALMLWAVLVPSLHSVWQVLLGAAMSVMSLGKMVAR